MRIIITKNGKDLLKQIEEEKAENINNNNFHFRNESKKNTVSGSPGLPKLVNKGILKLKKRDPSKTFYSFSNLKEANKSKSLVIIKEYFDRDISKVNQKELDQAKKITVAKPKIAISQKFLEKYINLDISFKDKLNNLSNSLNHNSNYKESSKSLKVDNNKNEEISEEFNVSPYRMSYKNTIYNFNKTANSLKKRKTKLGEIISQTNLSQLKSYLSKDNIGKDDVRLPLDKNNINSYNFRSKFENKKEAKENLENILNKSINSDRTNLINYIKRKKYLSPFYFKNLFNYDEGKIYKLNKMCGKFFEQEKKENYNNNLNKKESEKRVNHINLKNKDKTSVLLQYLLNQSNSILNDYSIYVKDQNKKKKIGFKEMIKNTKRNFWDKFKIDNLFKRNRKYQLEGSDKNIDSDDNNSYLFDF